MGMTIDEHIEVLKSYNHGFTAQAGNLQDSIDVAIEIMRKYQDIERIYQEWNEVNDFSYNQAMRKIGEVIEDGKEDGNVG